MKKIIVALIMSLFATAVQAQTSWENVTEKDPFTEVFAYQALAYNSNTAAGAVRLRVGCQLIRGEAKPLISLYFRDQFGYRKGSGVLRYRLADEKPKQAKVWTTGEIALIVDFKEVVYLASDLAKGKDVTFRIEAADGPTSNNFVLQTEGAGDAINKAMQDCGYYKKKK